MQGAGASDTDATVNSGNNSSTADVDDSDGAGERMERTVPSEQQDRTSNQQQQQQQTSSTPSGVLGECPRRNGKRRNVYPASFQWRPEEAGYLCSSGGKKDEVTID